MGMNQWHTKADNTPARPAAYPAKKETRRQSGRLVRKKEKRMAQSCSAGTREYQVDIGKLALRRLMAIDPGDAEILQQLEAGKDHIQLP